MAKKPRKTNLAASALPVILTVTFLCGLCSCVPVLIGTGVVVGYSVSNDSAAGEVKCDYRTLWDVTMDKLQNLRAEILTENESKGLIKTKISNNDVVIKINTISESLQKLKITARKYLLPKPQFAQKVFVEIIKDLE